MVTYTGDIEFVQIAEQSANHVEQDYFVPNTAYLSDIVENAPTGGEIIALSKASNWNRITFSEPVTNPVMAIVSLGTPPNEHSAGTPISYEFDAPFEILSQGEGYWGNGTLTKLYDNTLQGMEGNGVIQFIGTFTSISWTVSADEYWHGFTVGIPNTLSEEELAQDHCYSVETLQLPKYNLEKQQIIIPYIIITSSTFYITPRRFYTSLVMQKLDDGLGFRFLFSDITQPRAKCEDNTRRKTRLASQIPLPTYSFSSVSPSASGLIRYLGAGGHELYSISIPYLKFGQDWYHLEFGYNGKRLQSSSVMTLYGIKLLDPTTIPENVLNAAALSSE